MRVRVFSLFGLIVLSALTVLPLPRAMAQTPVDQAIAAKFPLTVATAALDDIVTPGAVMTLKQKGILMFATSASVKAQLVYKDGKVSPTTMTKIAASSSVLHTSSVVQRTYVTGEKLWLVDVKDSSDGVTLQLLSDAVGDVRYTTFLKFQFPKGGSQAPEGITEQIAQVLAPEGGGPPQVQAKTPPPPPHQQRVLDEPVAPPDMPAPAPATVEKGQTKDQVVAAFGQPLKVVKAGTKEIDTYKDFTVTYQGGKVLKVE